MANITPVSSLLENKHKLNRAQPKSSILLHSTCILWCLSFQHIVSNMAIVEQ